MDDLNFVDQYKNKLRRNFLAAIVIWTVLIFGFLFWDFHRIYTAEMKTAVAVAADSYEKELVYRNWVSKQGGVYAPVSDEVQPNPYLNVAERDIVTTSGKKLTLVNPAYMVRLVQEFGKEKYGVSGHLTSLNPIRPQNAPDAWEENALRLFENGVTEHHSLEPIGGKPYLRYMSPLIAEKSCLDCHAGQGYKEGEIRGGLSVSVSWTPFLEGIRAQQLNQTYSHISIWLFGIMIIVSGYRIFKKKGLKQILAEMALRESEERFRTLFEKANDGMLLLSPDAQIVKFNESFAVMHGYTDEEMKNFKISDLNIEDLSQKIPERMERILAGENLRFEAKHRHKNGRIIDLEVSAYLLALKDGNYAVTFNRDVTERKRAEEKIKGLLAEKEIILKEVHHRIKNNMNIIAGLLYMQSASMKDPSAAASLIDARSRVLSMMTLYDKLYRLENIDELSLKEFLSALVDEIIDTFPDKDKVKIEKDIDDLSIDSKRLADLGIFINEIITNIMKYAFAGKNEGSIRITAKAVENRATLSIEDNGIGIPESISIENSTGFGLQVVDMMAHVLHGKVKIERNNGTKFILEFDL